MRKVLTILLAGWMLLILASCGSSSSRSFVRIVNASPDAGSISVSVNGSNILRGAAYGSGSNYFTVAPGSNIDLKIVTTGTNPQTLDTKIALVDKSYYTFAAVGLVASSTFSVFKTTDDHSAPASGDVKIRVLQLDPVFHTNPGDTGPVDAYISAPGDILNGAAPTFPSLTFQATPSFASPKVPTTDGNLRIRVAPAGDSNPDTDNLPGWDSQIVNFTAGQVRTYVLLNNPSGTPFPNQSLMLKDLN